MTDTKCEFCSESDQCGHCMSLSCSFRLQAVQVSLCGRVERVSCLLSCVHRTTLNFFIGPQNLTAVVKVSELCCHPCSFFAPLLGAIRTNAGVLISCCGQHLAFTACSNVRRRNNKLLKTVKGSGVAMAVNLKFTEAIK